MDADNSAEVFALLFFDKNSMKYLGNTPSCISGYFVI